MAINTIQLSLFVHQINALCGEMGAKLRHAAVSPNIRDRLDYSCAMFDCEGKLCGQAAHIPVHLGSMAYAMRDIVSQFQWQSGDIVIFNDPYLGGTHLPDITLISPVVVDGSCLGFVANRAHHADIGATEPGSMPLSTHIQQEGIVLEPQYLGQNNSIHRELFDVLFSTLQNRQDTYADLNAQLSANLHGVAGLQSLIAECGIQVFNQLTVAMFEYAHTMARNQLGSIPFGRYSAIDFMEDDGAGRTDIEIQVDIDVNRHGIAVDFTQSARQVTGNINCPKAVTAAAVFYVFRCLMNDDVPVCHGAFSFITITTQPGTLVDAQYPAAVAAGNVETSMRIVDVLFKALSKACPERVPASSQGTMNNVAMGAQGDSGWSYYETIGGGAGASAWSNGLSAVQTHMTNTQNTPIEVLEMNYPVRITRYQIRTGSGGAGRFSGGNGIIREFEFLKPSRVTLLSERRRHAPAGLQGGRTGATGKNQHNHRLIGSKVSLNMQPGDRLRIDTPGGGGFGQMKEE